MDCKWFSSSCVTGKPILDECICLKPQGKNIFADIDICEDFEDKALAELEEKIELVKKNKTWEGINVDEYIDKVRGRTD